jgi:hypothetical protein
LLKDTETPSLGIQFPHAPVFLMSTTMKTIERPSYPAPNPQCQGSAARHFEQTSQPRPHVRQ